MKRIKRNKIILIKCPICSEPEYIVLNGNYSVLYKECKNSPFNEKYHLQIEKNLLGYSIKASFFSRPLGRFLFSRINYRKPTLEEFKMISEDVVNSGY